VLYVFFIGVLVVLAADLYIVYVAFPNLPELKLPNRVRTTPRRRKTPGRNEGAGVALTLEKF
jgi:hypothetical protein